MYDMPMPAARAVFQESKRPLLTIARSVKYSIVGAAMQIDDVLSVHAGKGSGSFGTPAVPLICSHVPTAG
jgi:hypothetical protein